MMITRMQIASIDVDLIHLPAVAPPYAWRRGLRGSHPARTTAVLRITTEDGAVGEAYHEWSGRCWPTSSTGSFVTSSSASAPIVASGCGIGSGSSTGPRSSRSGCSASSTSRSGTSKGGCSVCRCTGCSAPTATRSPRTRRRSRSRPSRSSSTSATSVSSSAIPAIKLHAWGDARADADSASVSVRTSARKSS